MRGPRAIRPACGVRVGHVAMATRGFNGAAWHQGQEGPATPRDGSEHSTHSTLRNAGKGLILESRPAGRVTEPCTTSRAFGIATFMCPGTLFGGRPWAWPSLPESGPADSGCQAEGLRELLPGRARGIPGWVAGPGSEARGVRWSGEAAGRVAAAPEACLLPSTHGKACSRWGLTVQRGDPARTRLLGGEPDGRLQNPGGALAPMGKRRGDPDFQGQDHVTCKQK